MTHRVLNMRKAKSILHIIVMSWRQSNATILIITTMTLWWHASYGWPVASGAVDGWTHWTVFMNSYILLKSLKPLQWEFLSYQISLSLIIGNLKVSTLTNRKTTKGNCHISISLWNVTNFKRYQFYFFVYMCTFMGHCGENYPL